MDSNETLKLLRTIAYRVESSRNPDALDLAQLFLDLDSWILGGGFLPDSWKGRDGIVPIIVTSDAELEALLTP